MAEPTLNTSRRQSVSHALSVDPFRSLYVHFGMLLGVDDFQTLDAYHRGKSWYHSAWLHGQGVLWGLKVGLEQKAQPVVPVPEENRQNSLTGELRVHAGAAVDALGRELYLPSPVCLDIGAWYQANKGDAEMIAALHSGAPPGEIHFDAHVSIQFNACLDRQVPALSEPCDGASSSTAYSRVVESVSLKLHPKKAPEWRAVGRLPFHRVRVLMGLEAPLADTDNPGVPTDEDQAVLDARAELAALPELERPERCLEYLRHFSVLDEMAYAPEQGVALNADPSFPSEPPAGVYLADVIRIRLQELGDGYRLLDASVDNHIRPVHMPTSTIQELVCGCCAADGTTRDPGVADPSMPVDRMPIPIEPALLVPAGTPELIDAGGPRVDGSSVTFDQSKIQMTLVGSSILKASVGPMNVEVSTIKSGRNGGWQVISPSRINFNVQRKQLTITLNDPVTDAPVRVRVRGTGLTPVLDKRFVPLAGGVTSPPGTAETGHDFVITLTGEDS